MGFLYLELSGVGSINAMNRRKRKKQQNQVSSDVVLEMVKQIDWTALKEKSIGYWHVLPQLHRRGISIITVVLVILLLIPSPQTEENDMTEPESDRVSVDINTRSLSEQKSEKQDPLLSAAWHEYTVQSGDTLARVFRSNGLPMSDLNALVKVEGKDKPLSHIKKGQLVRYKLKKDGGVDILQLEKQDQSVMFFRLSNGDFGRSKQ